MFNKFARTVTIRGVTFKPNTGFIVNFDAIHKDPKEWIEPEKFEPDRFDSKSPYFLRPDGKMRNPFSFNPFFGGKRVCMGRSLAEYMTSFTLPLLMYHFDFRFTDPAHNSNKPNFQLATHATPVIKMQITTRRRFVK